MVASEVCHTPNGHTGVVALAGKGPEGGWLQKANVSDSRMRNITPCALVVRKMHVARQTQSFQLRAGDTADRPADSALGAGRGKS